MKTAKDFIEQKQAQFQKELGKNRTVSMKDISRTKKNHFVREAWTFMPQSTYKEKVFVIERLRGIESNKIEYRIGYYIVGKIRKANGKWVWGQFCPLIPAEDFNNLIAKAKKEKTIK